jgi:aerobic-type carbon monoxide dehydrogenase small subunit (CoxS/CutS family)
MNPSKILVHLRVNGEPVALWVEPRQHLVDFLRGRARPEGFARGLRARRVRRLHGQAGRRIVRGCLVLAVQADGHDVQTIEGVSDAGAMRDLQQAFVARNALQCGCCTPGMLMAAHGAVAAPTRATRSGARRISGNYCRCTGYHAIVDAVCDARDLRLPRGARPEQAPRGRPHECREKPRPVPWSLTEDPRYIGQSRRGPMSARLTQGRGQYVDDLVLPRWRTWCSGAARCARTHREHRRRAARACPACCYRWTDGRHGRPVQALGRDAGHLAGMKSAPQHRWPSTAPAGRARPVVAVVAETRAQAEDALQRRAGGMGAAARWWTWTPRSTRPRR